MAVKMRVYLPALLLLIAGLAGPLPVQAQLGATTADISGVVTDETGGVIAGAIVTARETSTNVERSTTTGSEGRFVLAALQPGTYTITVAHPGFANTVQEGVRLSLGSLTRLEVTLPVGGIDQQVTVVAERSALDPQRTALSTVVLSEQVESLPINIRNFLSFSLLTPGVSRDVTPQQGASATSGLSFAGQRARSNNITVDGLDNNDSVVGSVRATFSQEAVREFQVVSTGYSAEFGKASGGLVNIVTKSGTNDPSGTAFIFYRNDALSARGYFEQFTPAGLPIRTDKAPYRQLQFGAVFGGPLKRNRTFYFGSFERLGIRATNAVTIDNAPGTLFGQPGESAVGLLRLAGFAIETGNVPYERSATLLLGKVDHHTDTKGSLSLRVSSARELDENIEPWGGLVARSAGAFLRSNDVMATAAHNLVASTKMLSELRVQVAYRNQDVISFDTRCDGLCDRDDEGGPSVEISGVATAGRQRFTPQPRQNLRVQIVETLSLFVGSHQFKTGVDYSYIDHRRQALPLHFGGRFIFLPLPAIPGVLPSPISSIEAFALGLPAAYVQGYGDPRAPYGTSDLALFAQDDWRLASNLTLKLGLRYQKQFWPRVVADVPGFGAYEFPTDSNDLAPRVGASWDPWRDQKTAVHGAYGVYYDGHLTALPGINSILGGRDGVRTVVLPFPQSIAAWQAPGRRLPEAALGSVPSTLLPVGPVLPTPYAHHVVAGVTRELRGGFTAAADFLYVRGFNQVAAIDYNPLVPALGPGRRPEDVLDPTTGAPVAGSSASLLQGTSWGETSYRGITVALAARGDDRYQVLASYTLSKAEDNSTDFQSAFIPENNGLGRDPADPTGLPTGFDPSSETGASLADRRHRLVLSGTYMLPGSFRVSAIASAASGRPYNILAGVDLNGDGDGGAFPPDRARRNLADPASSVPRNSGRLPMEATVDLRLSRRFRDGGPISVDALFEVFNLFNRTNFVEVNNIFGTGAYPSNPLPTFGHFERAGAPRQAQVGLKILF
jgi:hypothetical protein